ncbi:MAG: NAD(P)/FAD-dependent oxidoreductase [Euryarchaeota archaeon]|nr:NAD(P)/FAD-dependent oxidoreductase [Euryarchaeota archaeon]MDE1836603.1 NAD(P)/FAD-dependent oxidoreductase [Euryarchaeota archaeon]MDE1879202.1 NAD(P)/FAD-dependent oxidoreductase [Euryarchaeota archaeon]MDE2044573.1 NAD(P)/FAD-dependent oxidoreductase [Thermoplasmata archaeon]
MVPGRETAYQVVIVGGGYGGQAAAHELAKLGLAHKALLVDRRGRAGYPAASTSGIASFWLKKLGFPPVESSVSSPINSFRIFIPGDAPEKKRILNNTNLLAGDLGFVLNEDDFLGRLERFSLSKGLTAWHSCAVEDVVRSDGGYHVAVRDGKTVRLVTTRWVLDAGGYDARVSRKFGIVRELEPESFHMGFEQTIEENAVLPKDQVGMWIGSTSPAGYIWDFPCSFKGRPARRVGIGTPISVKDEAGRTIATKTFFNRWLKQNPRYDTKPLQREGGIIPTYRPPRTLHAGRVLSIGDSARLCDPVTGGGIHQALASGVMAARTVAEGQPDHYEPLVRPYTKEMRARWAMKQTILSMSDADLRQFFTWFCEFPMPEGDFNPYTVRRDLLRFVRKKGFRPIKTLWKAGRLWKALAG